MLLHHWPPTTSVGIANTDEIQFVQEKFGFT